MKDFKPEPPKYKGDGIDVWLDTDKNNETCLRIKKPEWNKSIVAFKYTPKPKEEAIPEV